MPPQRKAKQMNKNIHRASIQLSYALFLIAIAFNANAFAGINTIGIEENDKKMIQAFDKAKNSLDIILDRYRKRLIQKLYLKVKITDGNQVEYVWLGSIRYSHGKFIGRVDNDPETVAVVQIGQTFSFDKDEIFDWMYMKNDKMFGNYTLRAIINRIPPDESKYYKSILAPEQQLF